jgi:hypothetical protein
MKTTGGNSDDDRRLKRARVDDQQRSLQLLGLQPGLLKNIASTFIAFEFERYSATEDYLNFGLTCKFLLKLLTEDLTEKDSKALNASRRVRGVLMSPLNTTIVTDQFNNVSWRVCFETDLCVLVFFRPGIVCDGVRFVAQQAATLLEQVSEGTVTSWISKYLRGADDRYFGKLLKDRSVAELIQDLKYGAFRIEELMYIFQCMGFFLSGPMKLPATTTLLGNNPDWALERGAQLGRNNPQDIPVSHCLGITTDQTLYSFGALEPHSSALGRRVKVPSQRGFGFGKTQDDLALPFVGGPSGSSQAIVSVAAKAGLLQQADELKRQFLLATVAFLVGGGQHSFAELMHGIATVVEALGYTHGPYVSLLPQSLTSTLEWKRILEKYRDYANHL